MKIPTISSIPKSRLLITSSIVVGAVLTPFITYACYQSLVPEKPKVASVQNQKAEEKKLEDPAVVAAQVPTATPAPAAAPAPVVKPAPVPKPVAKTEDKKKSESQPSVVNSISLSGSGELVKWSVNGYSKKGFKVVWSKSSGPTYPTRSSDEYHYLSGPGTVKDMLEGFDGPGQYYVRVCEYLGGACGVYSNQIVVTLE